MSFCLGAARHRKWLIAILLAVESAAAFSGGGSRAFPAALDRQGPPILFPASLISTALAGQVKPAEGTVVAASTKGLESIQKAVGQVRTQSIQVLAEALGLSSAQIGQQAFEDSDTGMETLSGLGDGGAPVVAVKWRHAGPGQDAQPGNGPNLYLLSWDGNGWQASYLTPSADAITLQVLPVSGGVAPMFAVLMFRGATAAPYPIIFRFTAHHASLVWDGRADSSLYTGYDFGSVQFEEARGGNVPVMIAAGRADPGLLVFPASSEQEGRGFQAATVYAWRNDAYVPLRTEYTQNRDYTLYRFIAALHLHDFKTAYSWVDPKQFLKTDKPDLELFRKRIQNGWPEFTDDRIFEVPAGPENEPESHRFILRLGKRKVNVYTPSFTDGPAFRLTGLARTQSSE